MNGCPAIMTSHFYNFYLVSTRFPIISVSGAIVIIVKAPFCVTLTLTLNYSLLM